MQPYIFIVIALALIKVDGSVCDVDQCDWLNAEMKSTAKEVEDEFFLKRLSFWISKVKPHGDWDYKNNRYKNCVYVELCGQTYFKDVIGNIAYGYTGRVLFSEGTLLLGATAAQLVDTQSLDDPCDQNAVRVGSAVYDGQDLSCMLECYGNLLNREGVGSNNCTEGPKSCAC
eukprot:TRINITY_DN982_c0_g1_i4.p1 TRINITY_DN982_c0_g1~~TRINITY_DN982_c0_g1_i4.p1  ORF type:complete len:172 (-),score=9.27 TRINITY_DN982_c0_g1_i4:531-1046(-)